MNLLSSRQLLLLCIIFTNSAYSDENLNSGYAKLLALSLTDDISASQLNSDGFNYENILYPMNSKTFM